MSDKELAQVIVSLTSGKAPDGDGMHPVVVRALHEVEPELLNHIFNILSGRKQFSLEWKEGKVVLIAKLKKTD